MIYEWVSINPNAYIYGDNRHISIISGINNKYI